MRIDLDVEVMLHICDANEDGCGDYAIDKAAGDGGVCEAGGEHRGAVRKAEDCIRTAQNNVIGSWLSLPGE